MTTLDPKALEAVKAAPFRKYTIGETIDDTAIETIITAYLSALPAQPAGTVHDPIVWELEAAQRSHYEHFEGDSSGLVDDGERAKANKRLWAAIEATLDALSALPAQPVAVKLLEWPAMVGTRVRSVIDAHSMVQYSISFNGAAYCWARKGGIWSKPFATLDEAKAAAQADYEQRIRSALAAPSQQEGVTEEMVEVAAEAVYEHWQFGKDDPQLSTMKKPAWAPSGNSNRQNEARNYARAALEAALVGIR